MNLNVNQNASFKFSFTMDREDGLPLDIDGWEFRGSIKENIGDPDPPHLRFICVSENSDLYGPTPPSEEDASPSIVTVKLSASQTELLAERRYVYDIIAVDPNENIPSQTPPSPNDPEDPEEVVYRLFEGQIRVSPGVTDRDPTQ